MIVVDGVVVFVAVAEDGSGADSADAIDTSEWNDDDDGMVSDAWRDRDREREAGGDHGAEE